VRNVQAPLAVLSLRRQVEDYLEALTFSRAPLTAPLRDAMRHSLLAGGNRLRPVMALATADVLGRPPASVLPLAAALEMIHAHALMHLDLPAMSDGDVRGGKPTTHVVFGEDVALLAGDALFAEATALIFREQQGEPARVLAASAELMQEVGVSGLVGGLYADRAPTQDLDDDDLRKVYELKTDHLLAAAVGTVLILTGESGPAAVALRRFGAAVGVLSQIVGDVVDATASGQVPDTPSGGETQHAQHAKSTYVSAFGLQRARELARASHGHASAALAEVPADPVVLQGIADFILARQD
jgi:geranylgeranyl diphosphate synthase, type II